MKSDQLLYNFRFQDIFILIYPQIWLLIGDRDREVNRRQGGWIELRKNLQLNPQSLAGNQQPLASLTKWCVLYWVKKWVTWIYRVRAVSGVIDRQWCKSEILKGAIKDKSTPETHQH